MFAGEMAELVCGALDSARTVGTRELRCAQSGRVVYVTDPVTGQEFELEVRETNTLTASTRRARGRRDLEEPVPAKSQDFGTPFP
jgi:hypothetical protein